MKTFTIYVPSLQRLTIVDGGYDSRYVIDAHSLRYLKMKGHHRLLGSFLVENAPKVVEADIDINEAFCNLLDHSLLSDVFS